MMIILKVNTKSNKSQGLSSDMALFDKQILRREKVNRTKHQINNRKHL
jgi:hypothetical protein